MFVIISMVFPYEHLGLALVCACCSAVRVSRKYLACTEGTLIKVIYLEQIVNARHTVEYSDLDTV